MAEVKVEVQDFLYKKQIDQLKECFSLPNRKRWKAFFINILFTEKRWLNSMYPVVFISVKRKIIEKRDFWALGLQLPYFDDDNVTEIHLSCDIGNGNWNFYSFLFLKCQIEVITSKKKTRELLHVTTTVVWMMISIDFVWS